ncbi:DUF6777 domain-containing protein [Streptomyces pseudovenezuelae]|uniref:DUF6777 domain-containing protein n=1 Tax=Streptomyces pseudovenezuelae TaxID=67350 RepID=A0ABT6LY11_9ACTN|nr:DUF6777 domain-containing protein [Streptomyces pseudovenezuelae]MDH6220714.1 hypothetical protein [Streptomyces pseudovenezuelae]
MRTVTGTIATACALSAALLVAGCGGDGGKDTKSSGEVFLQPAAAQGPDPFTESTATAPVTPSPVTREPRPARTNHTAPTVSGHDVRSIQGGTPGLYAGTARVGSCDVNRQIDYLNADPSRARAFAQAEGVSQASVPAFLRGLAPVVLRADTRVTNHGYRAGRTTGFQSVLQAGTAVLVDNGGVPRVRCACGNPLKPPVAQHGGYATSGRPWSGYRPAQVVVVTPAPQVITNVTIINIVDNTWIERPIGHDVHHDHVVPSPLPLTPTPTPTPSPTTPTPSPYDSESSADASPRENSTSPTGESDENAVTSPSATDCVTPTVTVTPGATDDVVPSRPPIDRPACPTATVTATPPATAPTTAPDSLTPGLTTTVPGEPESPPDSADEIGPETVPETPDLPDGGGLIPDETDTTRRTLDSPTDLLGG